MDSRLRGKERDGEAEPMMKRPLNRSGVRRRARVEPRRDLSRGACAVCGAAHGDTAGASAVLTPARRATDDTQPHNARLTNPGPKICGHATQRESVRQSIDKALLMPVIVGLAAPTVLTAPTTAAFATTATSSA